MAMKTIRFINDALPGWKRSLDVGIILLSLPLVLPVALLVAAGICATSRGPILFRQERMGYLGERFVCFKFRTMFHGSDPVGHREHLQELMQSDAPMTKLDAHGDARIIWLGRFLRASGLDELPQLLNVLRGEMSLVGPRPCLPYEAENFSAWQRERFNAVPGLTGLWQVSGKNQTGFRQMVALDIQYARGKSLGLDLKIMALTPAVLLFQLFDLHRHENLARLRN
jgi:lipopolysaccharide/colanic/teichoic acid biosynthesis glycosyltransferase